MRIGTSNVNIWMPVREVGENTKLVGERRKIWKSK